MSTSIFDAGNDDNLDRSVRSSVILKIHHESMWCGVNHQTIVQFQSSIFNTGNDDHLDRSCRSSLNVISPVGQKCDRILIKRTVLFFHTLNSSYSIRMGQMHNFDCQSGMSQKIIQVLLASYKIFAITIQKSLVKLRALPPTAIFTAKT